ncbi:MAG: type 3 domain protein, partial [Pedosphaera sp.]|nr:type 3 domain protein [Pedosphaera sp.]
PGENYSVIGLLVKGDAVKPVTTKGEWTQIEAPTNAFAFVAAHLLTHKAPEPVAPPPPVAVAPTPTVVETPGTIAPPPTTPPGNTGAPAEPVTPPVPVVVPPIPAPLPPPVEEPLPPRIVERDGIVGDTASIQAPTHFQLKNLENGHVMDYLYTTSTNISLVRYRGRTIHVSGEEELDERWPNTPVLTIHRIQVVQ